MTADHDLLFGVLALQANQIQGNQHARPVVRGRPKPATEGRLKTSHFERTEIRHLGLPTAPALWEARDGESAQNGVHRHTSALTR
ncbi:MAG TPA: hypothetical protein VK395_05945, partial [Gemmataceae bacterium]|nr:hypothetical protein [Gemmataceae bacterium]